MSSHIFLNRTLITSVVKKQYSMFSDLVISTSAFNRYLWEPDYRNITETDVKHVIRYAPKLFKYNQKIDLMYSMFDDELCMRHYPEGMINGVYISNSSLFVKLGTKTLKSFDDEWEPIKEELDRCRREDINPRFEIIDDKRVDIVCENLMSTGMYRTKYMLVR